MTSTLIIDFLSTDHIDRNRRLGWNVRCENLEPIRPNLKKLSPKKKASRGLKSIVVTCSDLWPVSPKIDRWPRLFFVLKTDGGIQKLTWKNYRRPKNNRSRRFIFWWNWPLVKMYVSTQNVFSLIIHIVLHQIHWHLFCRLLCYLCVKNHKFGTWRFEAHETIISVYFFLAHPVYMSHVHVGIHGILYMLLRIPHNLAQ